jgi:polyisoprenoid-binding protein YceI
MSVYKKFVLHTLLAISVVAASAVAISDEVEPCDSFKDVHIDESLITAMLKAAKDGDLYRIKPDSSKMGFCVDSPVGMVEATFNNFEGGLALDAHSPDQGKALVKIDVASLTTSSGIIRSMLTSESFFDIEQYPNIMFVSKSFEWLTPEKAILKGDLTLHGVTKPVAFYVSLSSATEGAVAEKISVKATTTIQRSEFGMYTLSSVVSDRVNLCMSVDAYRYRPSRGSV